MMRRILTILFSLVIGWSLCSCRPIIISSPSQPTVRMIETSFVPTIPPIPTASTPEPQLDPVGTVPVEDSQVPLEIPFTVERPLSNPNEIVKILEILKQKHIEWLSRPGWYVYRMPWEDGEYRLWGTHFTNDQGDCREQFHLLEKGDELYPVEILLADGTWGRLYGVKGRLDQAVVIPSDEKTPCQMEDAYHVSTVIQMAPDIQPRLESAKTGEIEAYELLLWQEVIDGRKVVVLFEDMGKTKGVFRLADGTFVPVEREIHWTYLDPETGGIVGGDMVMYAEDGEILSGEEKGKREVKFSDLIFYDELPPEVLQAYEEAAEALRDFIQRSNELH